MFGNPKLTPMRRKKKNTSQQQKQQFRHQQNEFFKRIKYVMGCIGDASAYNMLDKKNRALLHYSRIRPYKIVHAETGDYPEASYVRELNLTLNKLLHSHYIKIDENNKVCVYDFAVYVENIHFVWRNMDAHNPQLNEAFKACFPLFNDDFKNVRAGVVVVIEQYLLFISYVYSRLTTSVLRIVHLKHEKKGLFDTSVCRNDYAVEHKVPVFEVFEIDGEKRKACRVWLNKDQNFEALCIPSGKFGISGLMEKFPLQVYIQQHAIDRMVERLSSVLGMFNYLSIIDALSNEPIPCTTSNGFLFPLRHGDNLLGYLKCDIVGDKLVIRTFLFITNNGTPEGKKLHEMFGLQKADKKYLGIDKLSTFLNSDIKDNKTLEKLFCDAGCGDLFKVPKTILDKPSDDGEECAAFMLNYLGMN
jgi:hypothetical protein